MTQEERIFEGILFWPGDPQLRAIKLRAHNLSSLYSRTLEDETEKREELLTQILGRKGANCFMQGPIFFHYGTHTEIGDNFFGNYNLTVQDDAKVTIGDNVNCGPNVTIVTPVHPADRLRAVPDAGWRRRTEVPVLRPKRNHRKRRVAGRQRGGVWRRDDRRRLRDRRGVAW